MYMNSFSIYITVKWTIINSCFQNGIRINFIAVIIKMRPERILFVFKLSFHWRKFNYLTTKINASEKRLKLDFKGHWKNKKRKCKTKEKNKFDAIKTNNGKTANRNILHSCVFHESNLSSNQFYLPRLINLTFVETMFGITIVLSIFASEEFCEYF